MSESSRRGQAKRSNVARYGVGAKRNLPVEDEMNAGAEEASQVTPVEEASGGEPGTEMTIEEEQNEKQWLLHDGSSVFRAGKRSLRKKNRSHRREVGEDSDDYRRRLASGVDLSSSEESEERPPIVEPVSLRRPATIHTPPPRRQSRSSSRSVDSDREYRNSDSSVSQRLQPKSLAAASQANPLSPIAILLMLIIAAVVSFILLTILVPPPNVIHVDDQNREHVIDALDKLVQETNAFQKLSTDVANLESKLSSTDSLNKLVKSAPSFNTLSDNVAVLETRLSGTDSNLAKLSESVTKLGSQQEAFHNTLFSTIEAKISDLNATLYAEMNQLIKLAEKNGNGDSSPASSSSGEYTDAVLRAKFDHIDQRLKLVDFYKDSLDKFKREELPALISEESAVHSAIVEMINLRVKDLVQPSTHTDPNPPLNADIQRLVDTISKNTQLVNKIQDRLDMLDKHLDSLRASNQAHTYRITELENRPVSTPSSTPGYLTTETQQYITDAVNRLIARRLTFVGKPDFALYRTGARIINSLTGWNPQVHWSNSMGRLFNWFGPFNWLGRDDRPKTTPNIVLDPSMNPGDCWPFPGSEANVSVAIPCAIYPSHFTIDHISPQESVSNRTTPRDFEVYGFQVSEGKQANFVKLATGFYDQTGAMAQTFPVSGNLAAAAFNAFQLRIYSNYGDSYTCLYRFRVHGRPQTSCNTVTIVDDTQSSRSTASESS